MSGDARIITTPGTGLAAMRPADAASELFELFGLILIRLEED